VRRVVKSKLISIRSSIEVLGEKVFKLSVISDEVSQDFERVAKFAKRMELDGIEIRTVWNLKPQELVKRLGDLKKILKEYDLEVSAIASPFFKANIDDPKEYEEHIEILKRCIELAKSLDTNIIRGFTFWWKGPIEENIERILEKFQKPLEMIESEGVILGVENEPSTFVRNGKELAFFLSKLKSKNVKALWDPGNDIWDPTGEVPYPDGYSYVRNKVVHVHVKDGKRLGKGECEFTPVGEGEVDYRGQLKALVEDGYRGYLSLETHWRPKKKLAEEEVLRPGGAAYSELGEEASEICMKNLKRIIEEVLESI